MRPSSWNGVGAIANVPAALAVSFMVCISLSSFRVHASRAPERQSSKPPRAHLDLLFGEEDVLGMVHDILRLPPRMRRLPAFHFHHSHLTHAARAGDAEHLAGLVARQFADHV